MPKSKEGKTNCRTYWSSQRQTKCEQRVDSADMHQKPTTNGTSPSEKMEYADKASPTANPEQLNDNANYGWNVDTGASSHMTPHQHWI